MRALTIALCLLAAPALADVAGIASAKCAIKDNVNRKGERIYHLPGGKWYDRTRIDPAKGERWFCSEAEARAVGWRRAGQ